jgi:hypothetical protein
MTPPIGRRSRTASPDERELLQVMQADHDYSATKRRLIFTFQHATAAVVDCKWPTRTMKVDLEPSDLRVVLDALRHDEAGGLDEVGE